MITSDDTQPGGVSSGATAGFPLPQQPRFPLPCSVRFVSRPPVAWALYDFANSAFTTLIVTFIFSAYFARAIAPDPDRGAWLWSLAVNASAIIVAIAVPFLGALADVTSSKKRFLAVSTLLMVIATGALVFVQRGDVAAALVLFVIANVGFEAGNVFYNAFLPEIAPAERIGRVSGLGQACGYAGGLISLVIALAMLRLWDAPADLDVRMTSGLVAAWCALFSLPLFLFVREKQQPRRRLSDASRAAWSSILVTVRNVRLHRNAAWLIVARMIYNDGLTTVFAFAAIFAAAVFGMTTEELIVLGIVLNVVSGAGSAAFGPLTDRIGAKRTIAITLAGLIVATLWGALAQTRASFWGAAVLLGWMIGPNQAASRSLLAELSPEDRHGEFFGFYAFSGKLAAVLGPALYGITLRVSGSQRLAIGSAVLFFIAGWLLLLKVKDPIPARQTGQSRS